MCVSVFSMPKTQSLLFYRQIGNSNVTVTKDLQGKKPKKFIRMLSYHLARVMHTKSPWQSGVNRSIEKEWSPAWWIHDALRHAPNHAFSLLVIVHLSWALHMKRYSVCMSHWKLPVRAAYVMALLDVLNCIHNPQILLITSDSGTCLVSKSLYFQPHQKEQHHFLLICGF